MTFFKNFLLSGSLVILALMAACGEEEELEIFFNEPVVQMKFINQDSLDAINETLLQNEWNRNALTYTISQAQEDRQQLLELVNEVQMRNITNQAALTGLEEATQNELDSLQTLLIQINNLNDPIDSVLQVKRQLEILSEYDEILLTNIQQSKANLEESEIYEPLILQLIANSIDNDLIDELDRQVDLLTKQSNDLTQTVRVIESGKLKLDSLKGIGSDNTLLFQDSLNNDSLQVFNFPLNMQENSSKFVIYIDQFTDTLTLNYNRELEESNDFAIIRAFNLEIENHTFRQIEVDCANENCESNETTITAYF